MKKRKLSGIGIPPVLSKNLKKGIGKTLTKRNLCFAVPHNICHLLHCSKCILSQKNRNMYKKIHTIHFI